jgi:hypothetical protein
VGPGTPPAAVAESKDASLLPVRVRRLSNFEYDRTMSALFGGATNFTRTFANDFRQSDFTNNASQQIDPTYAGQLDDAAASLARENVAKVLTQVGCQASQGEACANRVIADFGLLAYRRPLTDGEKAGLLKTFQVVTMDGGTFNEALEATLTVMLQSPNLLYLTELGDGRPNAQRQVRLTAYEIAAQLSYAMTGGPPDKALLDAAAGGKLLVGVERATQAKRLLGLPAARLQLPRMIKEWLQIDHLESTAKDAKTYPKYDELRPKMLEEADNFLKEALFVDDGTLDKVLTADYTVVDQTLGQFYGLGGAQAGRRTPWGTQARRGILMQAAFLSVHAHDNESSPIKRGNVLLKKTLCVRLPDPGELNLMVMPPPPDPNKTTREKFAAHSTDPACAGCHRQIDPFGFALEGFDGMGGARTRDNNKPVNTAVILSGADLANVAVKDGAEAVSAIAGSTEAKRCFARNVFRFVAGQNGESFENLFLTEVVGRLPATKQTDLKELLASYAATEAFVTRRLP